MLDSKTALLHAAMAFGAPELLSPEDKTSLASAWEAWQHKANRLPLSADW
jgi:hypothetical protein